MKTIYRVIQRDREMKIVLFMKGKEIFRLFPRTAEANNTISLNR